MAGERDVTYYCEDTDKTDVDQNIDALLSGVKWDTSVSNVITHSVSDSLWDLDTPF